MPVKHILIKDANLFCMISGICFPTEKGFYDIFGKIIPIFCMKCLIMRVQVIIDKTHSLHTVEHLLRPTADTFRRTLDT